MENVVSKRCLEEGCNTEPTYGYEEGVALYCKGHSLPSELLVLAGHCIWPLYGRRLESDEALRCQTGLISHQARAIIVKGYPSLVAK